MDLTVMDYLRRVHPPFVNDEGVIIPEGVRVSRHMKVIAVLIQPWISLNCAAWLAIPLSWLNGEKVYMWSIEEEVDA